MEFVAEAGGKPKTDSIHRRLEGLIGWSEDVVDEFGWAMENARVEDLKRLFKEARSAVLENSPSAMETSFEAIDKATDDLPKLVSMFLSIKGAINHRIRPQNPGMAADLFYELKTVTQALREQRPGAQDMLSKFMEKISEAISMADQEAPGGATCSKGHPIEPGARYCDDCGEDTWLLATRS